MIEFDIDWYGTYNRRSAIADYLELMALGGNNKSKEDLSDIIQDGANWVTLLNESIAYSEPENRIEDDREFDDTDLSLLQSEVETRVDDVQNVLRQRRDLLGDRYPFELDTDDGFMVCVRSTEHGPYLALLALTICHASGVFGLPRLPAYLFEDYLEESLNSYGLKTCCLGSRARKGGKFQDTLVDACRVVGLIADPGKSPHRKRANEEGSDTVTNLWPDDPRLGGVQFVGQATCAKSNSWKSKLMEPPVGHWEEWLLRKLAPIAFLSVPHHVEEATRSYLVSVDRKRDVLDRIRLAMVDRELLPDECLAIDIIMKHGATGF